MATNHNYMGDFVAVNDGAGHFSWRYLGFLGHRPGPTVIVDLESDGDLDILNYERWYINNGTGNFTGIPSLGGGQRGLAAGDLDGDGVPEIVDTSDWHGMRIFKRNETGGYDLIQQAWVGQSQEYSLALGDVDNDGDLDISAESTLWLNDGSGGFSNSGQNLHVGGTQRTFGREFADLDGDGDLDLVMATVDTGSYLLLNNGNGFFSWNGERLPTSANVAVADIDTDGFADLVLGYPARVYLGDGSGRFLEPVQTIEAGSHDLTLADLDGDAVLDLVLTNVPRDRGYPTAFLNTIVPVQRVSIDVKPGSDPNSVNVDSNGVIAVAILTTQLFDASKVDVGSVLFANATAVQYTLEDVDADGDIDMVLHFRTQDTALRTLYEELVANDLDGDGVLDSTKQEAQVSLTGETVDEVLFEGFDTLDLILSGRRLRELLDRLASEGAI